jgi:hypothetical protein
MSLVPPKELEGVIGGAPPGPLGLQESNAIGKLVTEGFKTWNSFDDTYRHEAEKIRAIDPGAASWSDLATFLTRYGDASSTDDVGLPTFEFRDDEIVAVEETLPALQFGSKIYACGDTGGLPIDSLNGRSVYSLGLNLPEVTEILRSRFIPDKLVGCALLRLDSDIQSALSFESIIGLLFFIRQTIHYELGNSREVALSLVGVALSSSGEVTELTSDRQAEVVRSITKAQRSKEPAAPEIRMNMKVVENEMIPKLRMPSDEEISRGIRHAVWPIAAIAFV